MPEFVRQVISTYTLMQFSLDILCLHVIQTFEIRSIEWSFVEFFIYQSILFNLHLDFMSLFFFLSDFSYVEMLHDFFYPPQIHLDYIIYLFRNMEGVT